MERSVIGEGDEQRVHRALYHPKVIKAPKLRHHIMTRLGLPPVSSLRNAFEYANRVTQGSEIVVPKTEFRKVRGRVFQVQDYIEPDPLVENPDEIVKTKAANIPIVLQKYESNPSNFIVTREAVYWIDPSRDFLGRILEDHFSIPYERYNGVRLVLRRLLWKMTRKNR